MVTDGDHAYSGEHGVMWGMVGSLWGTPETNITSYVSYTSIIKRERERGYLKRRKEKDAKKP